jgi:hypothetical protein
VREALIKLDNVNKELKAKLRIQGGKADIDAKWLALLDCMLVELIETRAVVDFALKKEDGIDWAFIRETIKKTQS